MSDSSCLRQRARSSTFIVSESLFPIRSHGEYHVKSMHTSFWHCCIHCCIHRIRLYNGMCLLSGQAQPRLTPTLCPFEVLHYTSRAFFEVIGSLLLLKHASQRWLIPHFLTFLTPSLRLLSYLALHPSVTSYINSDSSDSIFFLRFFKRGRLRP